MASPTPQRRSRSWLWLAALLLAGAGAWYALIRPTPEERALRQIRKLGGRVEHDPRGVVVGVDLSSNVVQDGDLKALAPLKSVHTLKLPHHQVRDGTLQEMAQAGLLHALVVVRKQAGPPHGAHGN